MSWYTQCDRTNALIAMQQTHLGYWTRHGPDDPPTDLPQVCQCGATTTTRYEQLSEVPRISGCPIVLDIAQLQRRTEYALRDVMEQYRQGLCELYHRYQEWDQYDDDGYWIGEDSEPDYPLLLPRPVHLIDDILRAAQLS